MESTNHNAWTLTKHVVQSINKGAAKIDVTIYGDKTNGVVNSHTSASPAPTPKPVNPNLPSFTGIFIGFLILSAVVFTYFHKKYP